MHEQFNFKEIQSTQNVLGEPQVWFAFNFHSDDLVEYEGAYVDNFVLQKSIISRPQSVWHSWFAVDTLETPYVGDFNGDGKTDIITFTRQNPNAVGDVYVALSDGTKFGVEHEVARLVRDHDGRDGGDRGLRRGRQGRHRDLAGEDVASGLRGALAGDGDDAGDGVGEQHRLRPDGRDPVRGRERGRQDGPDLLREEARKGVRGAVDGQRVPDAVEWHGFFAVSTYERPRVADVNGDGKADIVTFATDSPTAQGDVYVAVSDGTKFVDQSGAPNSSTKWHDWFAVQPTEQIRIGDIDGDGKEDFFTFMPSPMAQAYTVKSLGTSMGPNVLWTEAVAPLSTDVPYVGDANGDGKADIIIFAQGEGKVYVSLGAVG